ncbi:hypothetical protein GW930_03565 [Candidatus Saccharibacteria bacterium]|nr:hypothetical protein [Candidatus Saccharibacteria bacterium]
MNKRLFLAIVVVFISTLTIIGIIALFSQPGDQETLSKERLNELIGKDAFEAGAEGRLVEIRGDIQSFNDEWHIAKVLISRPDQHLDGNEDEPLQTVSAIAVVYTHKDYDPELVIDPFDYYTVDEITKLVAPSARVAVLESKAENVIYENL